jgi:8-oxo-dGTP pyrophosphatase MutT (NUDIX family)
MQPWKTLARQTILQHSRYLAVEDHTIQLPDGRIIPNWPWVILPDYVNVLAQTSDGPFLCFRQTKYAVTGPTLAPVGGYLEPDEAPLVAAQRELLEETGYTGSEWITLGQYPVDGNRGAGTAHLFLALGAQCVSAIKADDLEAQTLLLLNRAELEAALAQGEFKLLSWAALIALALRYLDSSKI